MQVIATEYSVDIGGATKHAGEHQMFYSVHVEIRHICPDNWCCRRKNYVYLVDVGQICPDIHRTINYVNSVDLDARQICQGK